MSTMRTAAQVAGVIAAAVAVGTAYVVVHEHRRRGKKERRRLAADGAGSSSEHHSLSAERLIEVLAESANAGYQLIEQVRPSLPDTEPDPGLTLRHAHAHPCLTLSLRPSLPRTHRPPGRRGRWCTRRRRRRA